MKILNVTFKGEYFLTESEASETILLSSIGRPCCLEIEYDTSKGRTVHSFTALHVYNSICLKIECGCANLIVISSSSGSWMRPYFK